MFQTTSEVSQSTSDPPSAMPHCTSSSFGTPKQPSNKQPAQHMSHVSSSEPSDLGAVASSSSLLSESTDVSSSQTATHIDRDMGGETNEATPAAFTPIEITNVDDDEDELMDDDQVTSQGQVSSQGDVSSQSQISSQGQVSSQGLVSSQDEVSSQDHVTSQGLISSQGQVSSQGPVLSQGRVSSPIIVVSDSSDSSAESSNDDDDDEDGYTGLDEVEEDAKQLQFQFVSPSGTDPVLDTTPDSQSDDNESLLEDESVDAAESCPTSSAVSTTTSSVRSLRSHDTPWAHLAASSPSDTTSQPSSSSSANNVRSIRRIKRQPIKKEQE